MNWISVKDRLPESEKEVLIAAKSEYMGKVYWTITTAMYEDGTIHTEDSEWNWYDCTFKYDEETDDYIIDEGWWEYRHYNQDDVYNNPVDNFVLFWMPLPEPPEVEDTKEVSVDKIWDDKLFRDKWLNVK